MCLVNLCLYAVQFGAICTVSGTFFAAQGRSNIFEACPMSRKIFEVSSLERGRSNVGSYRLKSLEWTFGRVSSLDLKRRLVPTAAVLNITRASLIRGTISMNFYHMSKKRLHN